jgi:homoserine dehydrogenase
MVAPLKVGLAGLGTVGVSVLRLIESDDLGARCGRAVEVVGVCARSKGKDRGVDLGKLRWFDDPVALARDPGIDVFVELMGGEGDPAKAAIEAALASGKSVVTANKALLARHGVALAALAEKNGVALNYEAAVGGAIPIVKTLREGLSGSSVTRVYGILNGTCNYILTRMEQEKLSFADCLKDAQRLGYAEADPAGDVEGFDAAGKLVILANTVLGGALGMGDVNRTGITGLTPADINAAKAAGERWKLIARARRTANGVTASVKPERLPLTDPLASVGGVTNAITYETDLLGPVTLVGPGAGRRETGFAILSDLIEIVSR